MEGNLVITSEGGPLAYSVDPETGEIEFETDELWMRMTLERLDDH